MHANACCEYRPSHTGHVVAEAVSTERLEICVFLHPSNINESGEVINPLLENHPSRRKYASEKQLRSIFSVNTDAMSKVADYFEAAGIRSIGQNLYQRSLLLEGSIAQLSELLNITFYICISPEGEEYLSWQGKFRLPAEIAGHISYISGLERGLRKARRSRLAYSKVSTFNPLKCSDSSTSDDKSDVDESKLPGYIPKQIEAAYHFPENNAEGECIGVVELGGMFNKKDLEIFCEGLDLPVPEVVEVGKAPKGSSLDGDVEINMDLQLIAGLAPGAKLVVYYASSLSDGIREAVYDKKHKPSVLSISWATGESRLNHAEILEMQYLCQMASIQGITIVAASGDHGFLEVDSQTPGVNYPAALPQVLAVGGTALWSDGSQSVWDQMRESGEGSGGNYSQILPVPGYQQMALYHYSQQAGSTPTTQRATPDLAANASCQTAYRIVVNNRWLAIGAGTSASTPVIAALVARLNKSLGYRLGFMHAGIYAMAGSPAWSSWIPGTNGGFLAKPGWDPCTGLGTPVGTQMLKWFKATEKDEPEV